MIPVLVNTPAAYRTISELPSAVVTYDRDHFAQLLSRVGAGVVWCPRVNGSEEGFYSWLRMLCGRNPLSQVFCIVAFHPESVRPLARVLCADFIWEHDLATIEGTLAEIAVPDPGALLDRFVIASSRCSELLGRAIKRLCDLDKSPIASVRELLEWLGHTDYAARKTWDACFGDRSPKEVIDWVLLMRALVLTLEDGRSSTGAAVRLGVHERTLERISLRVAKLSFAAAKKPDGLRRVMAAFSTRLESVLREHAT